MIIHSLIFVSISFADKKTGTRLTCLYLQTNIVHITLQLYTIVWHCPVEDPTHYSAKLYKKTAYRLGTVNSKSFVSKVLLRIKWKFELTVHFKHGILGKFQKNISQ